MKKIFSWRSTKVLSWLFVSNVFKSLTQWAILVVLVKFFATEEVGEYTYALAIASPIFMLTDMQLKSILVVEPPSEKDNYNTFLAIRGITILLTVLGFNVYFWITGRVSWIIIAVIGYKAVESMLDILYGYLQKKDSMIWMAQSDILKNLVSLFLCFCITLFIREIFSSLVSLVLVSFFFILFNYYFIRRYFTDSNLSRPSIETAIDVIKKSLPLGMSVFLVSYITNYPRIVVEQVCGVETLAYLGAYSYLAIGIFQISAPFQTFLRQRLSTAYQNGRKDEFKRKISRTIIGFIGYGFGFVILFAVLGNFIISILYKESYVAMSGVIKVMILYELIFTIAGFLATAVLSFNIYTKQVLISAVILLIVVVLSRPMISNYGLYGVAYVGCIAAFIQLLCYGCLYFDKMKTWQA